MQQRKQLFNKAKHNQTEEAWEKYHKFKNEIMKEINQAFEAIQTFCLTAKLIPIIKFLEI